MTARFASMDPKLRRILITVCTMTATVMQALDTTIANVALPYMQGSLSASLDQINWVLTSYIVAAAIMTATYSAGRCSVYAISERAISRMIAPASRGRAARNTARAVS